MKCESLQFDLPLYLDDVLSEEKCISINEHLNTCPLCRIKLEDFRTIKNDLRVSLNPVMPPDLLRSIRTAVAAEFSTPTINIATAPSKSFREVINYWLMPYSVGTLAALLMTFVLLSNLGNTRSAAEMIASSENPELTSPSLLAASNSNSMIGSDTYEDEYTKIALDGNTPRVNPAGALLALTKSIVRGEMKDEEVVIVADVFSDGIARISQVVKPPSNDESMRELEKAFRTDPENAPFLPPTLEKDSKAVRVILKIQRVDVAVPELKKKGREKISS